MVRALAAHWNARRVTALYSRAKPSCGWCGGLLPEESLMPARAVRWMRKEIQGIAARHVASREQENREGMWRGEVRRATLRTPRSCHSPQGPPASFPRLRRIRFAEHLLKGRRNAIIVDHVGLLIDEPFGRRWGRAAKMRAMTPSGPNRSQTSRISSSETTPRRLDIRSTMSLRS